MGLYLSMSLIECEETKRIYWPERFLDPNPIKHYETYPNKHQRVAISTTDPEGPRTRSHVEVRRNLFQYVTLMFKNCHAPPTDMQRFKF